MATRNLRLGVFAVSLLLSFVQRVSAEAGCSIAEDFARFSTMATIHSGSLTARLALPRVLYAQSPVALSIEASVSGTKADSEDLFISVGSNTFRIEDGALLRFIPPLSTRLVFRFLRSGSLEPVCSWQPQVRVLDKAAPLFKAITRSADIGILDRWPIHRIGEPIVAFNWNAPYTIAGVSMPEVAKLGDAVYLGDPAPNLGVRVIHSTDHDSPSLFVETTVAPARVSVEVPIRQLEFSVNGLADLRRPIYMLLVNEHPERISLNCGDRIRLRDEYWAEVAELRRFTISPNKVVRGQWRTGCSVKVLGSGEAGLWTFFRPLPYRGRRVPRLF